MVEEKNKSKVLDMVLDEYPNFHCVYQGLPSGLKEFLHKLLEGKSLEDVKKLAEIIEAAYDYGYDNGYADGYFDCEDEKGE